MGLIKSIHANAIEFTAHAPGIRGMVMVIGILGASLGTAFGYDMLSDLFPGFRYRFMSFLSSAFLLFAKDQPTIFDRKNRKVYRICRKQHAGCRGLFRPWPMKITEHDWDLIDAEHQAIATTTGASVMRFHALIFNVRKSATDPTIVDGFSIGNGMVMGEVTVPAVWEHIRRFMEEDGPHLPPGVKRFANSKSPHQSGGRWPQQVFMVPISGAGGETILS